jgi:hypothetical protein
MNVLSQAPGLGSIYLDHLVYATPTLAATVEEVGDAVGVTPVAGGRHVGRGTQNYLLGLGGGSYLEIIGRDPEQVDFTGQPAFGLDAVTEPRLVAWAIRVSDIDAHIKQARNAGYDPGRSSAMNRQLPNGKLLHWKLTSVPDRTTPALVPFLIDWGSSPHPSARLGESAHLVDFHFQSPDPNEVQRQLAALGVTVHGEKGGRLLLATISGPVGTIALT